MPTCAELPQLGCCDGGRPPGFYGVSVEGPFGFGPFATRAQQFAMVNYIRSKLPLLPFPTTPGITHVYYQINPLSGEPVFQFATPFGWSTVERQLTSGVIDYGMESGGFLAGGGPFSIGRVIVNKCLVVATTSIVPACIALRTRGGLNILSESCQVPRLTASLTGTGFIYSSSEPSVELECPDPFTLPIPTDAEVTPTQGYEVIRRVQWKPAGLPAVDTPACCDLSALPP